MGIPINVGQYIDPSQVQYPFGTAALPKYKYIY
jgi:hypothetical protein